MLPEQGRWAEKYRAEKRSLLRMEFSTFCVAMIQVPCQIVRTSGGSSIGCCRGTRGRESSCGWWSGCTAGGCAEPVVD